TGSECARRCRKAIADRENRCVPVTRRATDRGTLRNIPQIRSPRCYGDTRNPPPLRRRESRAAPENQAFLASDMADGSAAETNIDCLPEFPSGAPIGGFVSAFGDRP